MHLPDLYLVLALGFLSSLHCVQMCGPLVLMYSVSLNADRSGRPLLRAHLAYNAGRTLTYMLLGTIAGVAGETIGFGSRLAGIQNAATLVAGSAMLIVGVFMLGVGHPRFLSRFTLPARLLQPIGGLISSRSVASKFGLGLLLGLMPCGLLYMALLKAVGTADPVEGALTMLAFGLGTSVALIAVGLGSSLATRKLARWGTAVASVTVMALGAILIVRATMPGALMLGGGHRHHGQ